MKNPFDWLKNLFSKSAAAPVAVEEPTPQKLPATPQTQAVSPPVIKPLPPTTPQKVAKTPQTAPPEMRAAQQAWLDVAKYYREWGPQRAKGAPALPPRIEYTLRRIGGLANFRNVSLKEFVQAFNEAPIVDHSQNNALTDKVLDGNVRLNEKAVEP